ncbi:MAG TPA: 50S ribosomal protein L6 [Actinomycetota bacterium]|nr:50S ribosomal protein L6 [Actinomycetota bacterium]
MSRIGRMPIQIPDGVELRIEPGVVTARGPLGEQQAKFPDVVQVVREDDTLTVTRSSDARRERAFHGLARALVANAVQGVSQGFQKVLELRGVGYRAAMDGKDLTMQLGFSHPVRVDAPEGITFEVQPGPPGGTPPVQNLVIVKGASKELVGQVAATVRKIRPVEPYKGKGIRYEGEYVRRKAGKAAK